MVQVGLVLNGSLIEEVHLGSPAFHTHQLKKGDIICKINGQSFASENFLSEHLEGIGPAGSRVELTIYRPGTVFTHCCTLPSRNAIFGNHSEDGAGEP